MKTTILMMIPGLMMAIGTSSCERAESETRVGALVPEGQEVIEDRDASMRSPGLTPGSPVLADQPLPGMGAQQEASELALAQRNEPLERDARELQPAERPQPQQPAGGAQMEAQGPEAGAQVTLFAVELDPEIARRCGGLEHAQIYFDFDSSKVQSQYTDRLDQVAQCMSEGPLKGEELAVVGFADRRGPRDYNYDLGGRRADSVVQYLSGKGIEESKISTLSVGELFAAPGDGQPPAAERRVAIRLAKNVLEDAPERP